jgi:hypothetical protein
MRSNTSKRPSRNIEGIAKAGTERNPDAFATVFGAGIDNIVSYWLSREDNTFERWDADTAPVVVNARAKTVRFRVRPIGPVNSEPFEVVIAERSGRWYLKADCWDEPVPEYPLRQFESLGTTLFVLSDANDQIYLHIVKSE